MVVMRYPIKCVLKVECEETNWGIHHLRVCDCIMNCGFCLQDSVSWDTAKLTGLKLVMNYRV
jgi:hypothetical protein